VSREWESAPESVDQAELEPFLSPSLLVQSDDPRIRERAREIVGDTEDATEKARKIADWISRKMKSELRVSTPSAAEILDSMRGDCNEHATLFAALCRAVDVPTKICAGIVYQDGRFYYHAWNEMFDPGQGWVRVDTAFGQFPADPTHVKLAEGDLEEHVLIAQLVGKIEVEIIHSEAGDG
jgi:transglutaminase-like putative cysteine protease